MIKFLQSNVARDVYIVLIIVLLAVGSFGLGRLSKGQSGADDSVQIIYPSASSQEATALYGITEQEDREEAGGSMLVASKNGTKYHFEWCPGAKQMKEENKIYFSSKEKAEQAGYSKAANCKGL